MNTRLLTSPLSLPLPDDAPAGARAVLSMLSHLAHGQLTLQLPGGALHQDRKSTRLNSSHSQQSRMPSSA